VKTTTESGGRVCKAGGIAGVCRRGAFNIAHAALARLGKAALSAPTVGSRLQLVARVSETDGRELLLESGFLFFAVSFICVRWLALALEIFVVVLL
jgi:hypothetical protein